MFRRPVAQATHERARLVLIGVFAVAGVMAFSWLARIPSIRDLLELTPAELGVILLIGSTGALVTVFSAGGLITRFGSGRVYAVGAVVITIGFILAGLGTAIASRWVFGIGILVNGIGGSLMTVPMNVESARIERAFGRSVIPHFHAAFSAGAVGGSILGAAASSAGVPVWLQFAVVALVTGGVRLAALPAGLILPGTHLPAARRPSGLSGSALPSVWREPRTVLIGVVAFAAALAEGSANNWLSLSFVDGFAVTEAFGGIVLGVFIGTMTVGRIFGSRAIDRLGRVDSLRVSTMLSLAGLAVFGLSPSVEFALVGVALWGTGSSLCFPLAVAAASDEPWRAQARVSMMASLASVAVMTAAPLIGVVASSLGGPRQALLILAVPLLAALFASRWLEPQLAPVADPRDVLDTGPVPARALPV